MQDWTEMTIIGRDPVGYSVPFGLAEVPWPVVRTVLTEGSGHVRHDI